MFVKLYLAHSRHYMIMGQMVANSYRSAESGIRIMTGPVFGKNQIPLETLGSC